MAVPNDEIVGPLYTCRTRQTRGMPGLCLISADMARGCGDSMPLLALPEFNDYCMTG